ncbi:hypothetical protein B0H17DRAFT_1147396 [Mycena rosella]|uniref:Uncharacterized protein n=1 Tax=Mycena rosella TaxID=1033263 RepID=A0AAD7CLV5_MYCRO|nr:hypothetical protein B0H17DRAFT_1147396 [Mycena rosella]
MRRLHPLTLIHSKLHSNSPGQYHLLCKFVSPSTHVLWNIEISSRVAANSPPGALADVEPLCHVCLHPSFLLTSMSHPPMKSKYAAVRPTEHEQRKRAELKSAPLEDQAKAAARSRSYQATYREKNRADLKIWEAQRRVNAYIAKYGEEAYLSYANARRDSRRHARRKRLAKQAYHQGDTIPEVAEPH